MEDRQQASVGLCDLEECLCCLICCDPYDADIRVPKVLHCGHSLCLQCLISMADDANFNAPLCPRCRVPMANSHEVATNFELLAVVNRLGERPISPDDRLSSICDTKRATATTVARRRIKKMFSECYKILLAREEAILKLVEIAGESAVSFAKAGDRSGESKMTAIGLNLSTEAFSAVVEDFGKLLVQEIVPELEADEGNFLDRQDRAAGVNYVQRDSGIDERSAGQELTFQGHCRSADSPVSSDDLGSDAGSAEELNDLNENDPSSDLSRQSGLSVALSGPITGLAPGVKLSMFGCQGKNAEEAGSIRGMCITPENHVLLADYTNRSIHANDLNGNPVIRFGSGSSSQWSSSLLLDFAPRDLGVGPNGEMAVLGKNEVVVYGKFGEFLRRIELRMREPKQAFKSLAVGENGAIYCIGKDCMRKQEYAIRLCIHNPTDKDTTYVSMSARDLATDLEFDYPRGISVYAGVIAFTLRDSVVLATPQGQILKKIDLQPFRVGRNGIVGAQGVLYANDVILVADDMDESVHVLSAQGRQINRLAGFGTPTQVALSKTNDVLLSTNDTRVYVVINHV